MKMYKRKNVVFHPDSADDMELYKQLSELQYGDFSERTKEFWRKELCKEVQVKHIKLPTERTTEEIRKELDEKLNGGKKK